MAKNQRKLKALPLPPPSDPPEEEPIAKPAPQTIEDVVLSFGDAINRLAVAFRIPHQHGLKLVELVMQYDLQRREQNMRLMPPPMFEPPHFEETPLPSEPAEAETEIPSDG